jgi:hypothetical protein
LLIHSILPFKATIIDAYRLFLSKGDTADMNFILLQVADEYQDTIGEAWHSKKWGDQQRCTAAETKLQTEIVFISSVNGPHDAIDRSDGSGREVRKPKHREIHR